MSSTLRRGAVVSTVLTLGSVVAGGFALLGAYKMSVLHQCPLSPIAALAHASCGDSCGHDHGAEKASACSDGAESCCDSEKAESCCGSEAEVVSDATTPAPSAKPAPEKASCPLCPSKSEKKGEACEAGKTEVN